MTAEELQVELENFLQSKRAEVLCVTGDWGVGKTHQWQLAFDAVRRKRSIALSRYSYVSLFGINSLDGLKLSIFDNLEFITPDGETTYLRMLETANKFAQHGKKAIGALSAIPKVGDAISKLAQPYLFSSIKNQILCIDDLERRGVGLLIKDVLGLISYLREQRGCKIMLLLNESKIEGNDSSDFKNYFEKTIDSKIVFAPSPTSAAEIALHDEVDSKLSMLIANYTVKLQIRNIRVIKKIVRLIKTVLPAVSGREESIRTQIVHSLVMFGWSYFDAGASPPPLSYLRQGEMGRYVARENGKAVSEEERRWDSIISDYEFSSVDEFDLALLQLVETGQFNADVIKAEAEKQEIKTKRLRQAGSFEDAFRPLHDSFTDNPDEVSNSIVKGVKDSFDVLARSNVDQAVYVLRRLGRQPQADELIDYAIAKGSQDFWLKDSSFEMPIQDERIQKEIARRRAQAVPTPDFERDLLEAAQSLNADAIRQVSIMPLESFIALFKSKAGNDLRAVTAASLEYRQISNASDEMKLVVSKAEEALRTIGAESPLNALRAEKYGISP